MQLTIAIDMIKIFKDPCWSLKTRPAPPAPNRASVAVRKANEARHASETPKKKVRLGKYACSNRIKDKLSNTYIVLDVFQLQQSTVLLQWQQLAQSAILNEIHYSVIAICCLDGRPPD
jgi:hypothetical protein